MSTDDYFRGVSNLWNGLWNGLMEWTDGMEYQLTMQAAGKMDRTFLMSEVSGFREHLNLIENKVP